MNALSLHADQHAGFATVHSSVWEGAGASSIRYDEIVSSKNEDCGAMES